MRRLVRPNNDRVISGVCAAIANYFGIDSTVVRIIYAALIFMAGTGVFAYILMALIIPSENEVHDRFAESTMYNDYENNYYNSKE